MSKAAFSIRSHNPDVLTCIANLSNDEVFTPPELANQMLDSLQQAWSEANSGANIWENKDITFLDPCTKSGVFLREIVRRLSDGLSIKFPDLTERVNHILTKQVFGIGITELTSLIARRSVYCSKYANGIHSVARTFNSDQGNIWYERVDHTWESGRCKHCGANENEHSRSEELESHAYKFTHTANLQDFSQELFGADMHFDVIIGNPPYQLNDGGNGSSAIPIYHKFIEQAKRLEPRFLSFVIPARWLAGGKGLSEFRENMLNDERLMLITDYINSKECFPGVSIGGGVCFFLWSREYVGPCNYTNVLNNSRFSLIRKLNEYPIFIRYNQALSIVSKLNVKSQNSLALLVDSRNPFGLASSTRGKVNKFHGALSLYSSDGISYIKSESVTNGNEKVSSYKLMVSKVISEHAGEPDKNGKMKIISTVRVLKPKEVCTDSYLCVGKFSNLREANNLLDYLRTKFVRFLMMQAISSINLSRDKFYFVPIQDFTEEWNDQKLYKKYSLTESEIAFIEKMIKSMSIEDE